MVDLAKLGLPAGVLDSKDRLLAISEPGGDVFRRMNIRIDGLPTPLPADLRGILHDTAEGEPLEWNGAGVGQDLCLGCTWYALGPEHRFLVMRELSPRHRELSRRLHQERLRITGRLVASLMHDLRSPAASILFNAEWLSAHHEEISSDGLGQVADDLALAAQSLRSTIDGLLSFTRSDPREPGQADVNELLARVSGLLRPLFRARQHALLTSCAEGVDLVRGGGLLIEQILVNLVVNAAEASTDSGGEVRLDATRRGSAADPDGGWIVFDVVDDGPGIAERDRPHVFQPFFTTRKEGTGLGLTDAREVARALGGELSLLPTPASGRGTHFRLELPGVPTGDPL